MFKNISLGIYYPGNSLLHRLQARTKLLVLLWLVVSLTLANRRLWHFAPYIAVVVLLLLGVALSGVSARHLWQRMWLLVTFAILGAIPTLLFTSDIGQPLYTFSPSSVFSTLLIWAMLLFIVLLTLYILLFFLPIPAMRNFRQQPWLTRIRIPPTALTLSILAALTLIGSISFTNTFPFGPLVFTYENVWLLMTFFTLFLLLYAFSLLLTMTTTPIALIEGLTLLLTPLRWLRLPVDDFALMTLIALRFIPTFIEEIEQLIKAQTARGADFSHGTIRERVQSLAALFVPLIQGTLRRAADLATALEARGYEFGGHQTFLHEKSLGPADYAVLAVVVLVMIGALIP